MNSAFSFLKRWVALLACSGVLAFAATATFAADNAPKETPAAAAPANTAAVTTPAAHDDGHGAAKPVTFIPWNGLPMNMSKQSWVHYSVRNVCTSRMVP